MRIMSEGSGIGEVTSLESSTSDDLSESNRTLCAEDSDETPRDLPTPDDDLRTDLDQRSLKSNKTSKHHLTSKETTDLDPAATDLESRADLPRACDLEGDKDDDDEIGLEEGRDTDVVAASAGGMDSAVVAGGEPPKA